LHYSWLGGTLLYTVIFNWYQEWKWARAERQIKADPLMALYGSGKDVWADEHADEYVNRLREGWR
jgi:hypothetical protein